VKGIGAGERIGGSSEAEKGEMFLSRPRRPPLPNQCRNSPSVLLLTSPVEYRIVHQKSIYPSVLELVSYIIFTESFVPGSVMAPRR
jgi:hypothetical protein